MIMDIPGNLFCWNVIIIAAERVFNFFSNQFKAGQNIKYKNYYGYYIVTQAEHITNRKGHDIDENEFFYEHAV